MKATTVFTDLLPRRQKLSWFDGCRSNLRLLLSVENVSVNVMVQAIWTLEKVTETAESSRSHPPSFSVAKWHLFRKLLFTHVKQIKPALKQTGHKPKVGAIRITLHTCLSCKFIWPEGKLMCYQLNDESFPTCLYSTIHGYDSTRPLYVVKV